MRWVALVGLGACDPSWQAVSTAETGMGEQDYHVVLVSCLGVDQTEAFSGSTFTLVDGLLDVSVQYNGCRTSQQIDLVTGEAGPVEGCWLDYPGGSMPGSDVDDSGTEIAIALAGTVLGCAPDTQGATRPSLKLIGDTE